MSLKFCAESLRRLEAAESALRRYDPDRTPLQGEIAIVECGAIEGKAKLWRF
jgi:hypothetical protein